MGHLNEDGSMDVPVDCIVEAARSLEAHTLTEAAEIINNEQMISMLQSGEALVERVGEARERKLRQMIRKFQSEGDTSTSHRQWKRIEREVFGVEYNGVPMPYSAWTRLPRAVRGHADISQAYVAWLVSFYRETVVRRRSNPSLTVGAPIGLVDSTRLRIGAATVRERSHARRRSFATETR